MYCRAGGHILEMFPLSVKFEMVFENLLVKESYRNIRELLMVLSSYVNQGRQGKMSFVAGVYSYLNLLWLY